MDFNPASLLIAALAFAFAFGVSKVFVIRKRRRDLQKQQSLSPHAESRQVRRLRERRTGG